MNNSPAIPRDSMSTFVALLPASHEARTLRKVAIQALLEVHPLASNVPATLGEAREWLAACHWLEDPVNTSSPLALHALSVDQRNSICALMALEPGGPTGAVCEHILRMVRIRTLVTPFAEVLRASFPNILGELEGLSQSDVMARLQGTPVAAIAANRTGADLRDYAAMAWWLFFHCNSGADVEALRPAARQRVWDSFRIPAEWDQEVRHATIEAVLRGWHARHQGQATPPSPPRSRADDFARGADDPAPLPRPPADVCTEAIANLSMQSWTLGAAGPPTNWWNGHAHDQAACKSRASPMATNLGAAQLGVSGVDGDSAFGPLLLGGYAATSKMAYEVAAQTASAGLGSMDAVAQTVLGLLQDTLSLRHDPFSFMNAEWLGDLKVKQKAESADNRRATPPFAEFPHLQPLRLQLGEPLDMLLVGTKVRLALIADSAANTDSLAALRRNARQAELGVITAAFSSALEEGEMGELFMAVESMKAFCLNHAALNRTTALQNFRMFPSCDPLKEVAAGRDVIHGEMRALYDLVTKRLTHECRGLPPANKHQLVAGAWGLFMEGFTSESAIPTPMLTKILAKGAAFAVTAPPLGDGGFPGNGGGGGDSGSVWGISVRGGEVAGKGSPPARKSSAAHSFPGHRPLGRGRLQLGHHIPASAEIIGPTIGISTPTSCMTCGSTLHCRGECPKEWASHGRPLPGFSRNGKRLAGKWNGAEPKRATFVEWLEFLEDADNFPHGAQTVSSAGAPGIEEVRGRAKKAPP